MGALTTPVSNRRLSLPDELCGRRPVQAPGLRPGPDPGPVALASRNPDSQIVTLILDTTTANAVMFAIAAYADEREAHIREVERYGQTLPEGSYGRQNRHTIATARHR